jgi:hypothetical protein
MLEYSPRVRLIFPWYDIFFPRSAKAPDLRFFISKKSVQKMCPRSHSYSLRFAPRLNPYRVRNSLGCLCDALSVRAGQPEPGGKCKTYFSTDCGNCIGGEGYAEAIEKRKQSRRTMEAAKTKVGGILGGAGQECFLPPDGHRKLMRDPG